MLPAESLMCSRRLMSVLHYYYYEMYVCNLNTDLAFMFRIKSMQRHLQMTCTSTDTINKIRWFRNLCAVSERPRRGSGRVIKIRRRSMKRFGFGSILFGLLLLIFIAVVNKHNALGGFVSFLFHCTLSLNFMFVIASRHGCTSR